MKIGLNLARDRLTDGNLAFAAQAGTTHIVAHLTDHGRKADPSGFLAGEVGPSPGDCTDTPLWNFDDMAGLVRMVRGHGLELAALENFQPNFWSDILLDGPQKQVQLEALKCLVRDAGRAGIPCIGYNFSIAGVWGWQRGPYGRGGAMTVGFDMAAFDHTQSIPDGMVWNMRYRPERPGAPALRVSEAELWDRLALFLREMVPVAQQAGVVLAAHPDDPPATELRGTARLVNDPAKYDRLLDIVDSPANALELCLGSIQEMPVGDIYQSVRSFARRGRIGYIHFRNVSGKVPRYRETFVDDGDVDMAEIVRILRDESYDGVLVPDHTPEMRCDAPWHAGMAFALGYMRALVANADALGPSRTAARAPASQGAPPAHVAASRIATPAGTVAAATCESGGPSSLIYESDAGRVRLMRRHADACTKRATASCDTLLIIVYQVCRIAVPP